MLSATEVGGIISLFSEIGMELDLMPVLSGELKELPFTFTQSACGEAFDAYFKGLDIVSASDIEVSGKVYDISGYLHLVCRARLPYKTTCSRCGAPVDADVRVEFERIVSNSADKEEDDDYIVYSDRSLELDGPVFEELSISFPSKQLCRPDCKGLCPVCGQDLNEDDCEHSRNTDKNDA